jgi:hypothetical protein
MWSISSINTMSSNFIYMVCFICVIQSMFSTKWTIVSPFTKEYHAKRTQSKHIPNLCHSDENIFSMSFIINVMYAVSSKLSSLIHVLKVHPFAFASIILSTFIHLNETEQYLMHPCGLLSSTWSISLHIIKGHAYLIHTISFIMSWISSVRP